MLTHDAAKAHESVIRREQLVVHGRDHHRAPASAGEQLLRRHAAAHVVVAKHRRQSADLDALEGDDRKVVVQQRVELAGTQTDDDAVHLIGLEHPDILQRSIVLAVGRIDHHLVSVPHGGKNQLVDDLQSTDHRQKAPADR